MVSTNMPRSYDQSSIERRVAAYPAGVTSRPTVPDLWRTYSLHAEAMLSAGPAPQVVRTSGAFIALSGAPHVDLNQAVVFGDGDQRDAQAIAEVASAADVPCLLGISATVHHDVSQVLREAGFEPLPEREALFFAPQVPPVGPSAFQVARVVSSQDLAGVRRVFAESHDYDPDLVARMWGTELLDRADVGGWLAWDGYEPVSCVFVTRVGRSLGVFDMMTPTRHRRRGAARAVLTQALLDATAWDNAAADAVAFWASPAGRPLYESLGFTVVDDLDVWTLGASPEDLAAVGAG
jgi:N-acetylglutamate synthase